MAVELLRSAGEIVTVVKPVLSNARFPMKVFDPVMETAGVRIVTVFPTMVRHRPGFDHTVRKPYEVFPALLNTKNGIKFSTIIRYL